MEDSTNVPQKKNGGYKKLNGEDGKHFSKDYQPSNAVKQAGWDRKKFTRQVLKEMLDMKYKFSAKSPIKKSLVAAYGEQVLDMTVGQLMGLQQMEKAIKKSDSIAFTAMINQALGMPKQETEITERKIVVTRKKDIELNEGS
jgi:hypothetical protein